MINYYRNILSQMNYTIDDRHNFIFDFDGEPLKRQKTDYGYVFKDKNWRKTLKAVEITEYGKYTFVNGEKLFIDAGNVNNRSNNDIYNILIRTLGLNISINVSVYSYKSSKEPVGKIEVGVTEYGKEFKKFIIQQYDDCAILSWSDKEETTTIDNNNFGIEELIKGIIGYVNLYVSNNVDVQRGLKMILPSLRDSINDMLYYKKNYTYKGAYRK